MEILYEDSQLLVCVKPRGIRSVADAGGKPSVASLLAPRALFPVHRLDREVPGLMVFAKTREAAASLSAAMGSGIQKEYLALCETGPDVPQGVLEDLLFHDKAKNKTYVTGRKRAGVKEAKLAYQVFARLPGGGAAVHIRLFTGRTHQIRVQFASRRWPLLGDRKYGAKTGGSLQLYAWRLTVPHPDGRILSFTLPTAQLPEVFQQPDVPLPTELSCAP